MSERKVTVVSIVPFLIEEFKPGIYPGFFSIPASKNEFPEILHVGESVFHVEIDESRSITVKCSPDEIARSLVDDYVTANLEYSIEKNAKPGLFWLPEEYSVVDVVAKFPNKIEEAKVSQKNWFLSLVKLADDDWEKSRQHKFISDMQRFAARALGLTRPWIIVPKVEVASIKCFACKSDIAPNTIVCPHCKFIVDKELWQTIKSNFATMETR